MRRGAWILLVLAAGCSVEARRTLGEQCELNSECNTPLVCGLGRCHVACVTDRDCPFGARCVETNQRQGMCLLPDESTCVQDGDCPSTLVCRNERCVNECEESRDCPAGSICTEDEAGRPSCEPVGDEPCVRHSDCEAPRVCGLDQRCRAECVQDRDCARHERCAGGVCAVGAPPADAGPDAATGLDGGPPSDAGPPDDGGATDAGDASTTDAGPAPFECTIAEDCTGADASFECRRGRCVVVSCAAGVGDCDLDPSNGCEQTLDTAAHCGGCGLACPGPGASCGGDGCTRIAQIEGGDGHYCYRWEGGAVYCWGNNDDGQLGDGTTMDRDTPVQLTGLDAIDVTVGDAHGCAVRRDGTVACWGNNDFGQLGDDSAMARLTPVSVVGLPDASTDPAVDVSAGDQYTCAVTSGGAMYCWGRREHGRLGDGERSDGSQPTAMPVSGGHRWSSVAAGGDATCGVRTDGVAMCFGHRHQGQLGDGGDTGFRQVAAPREVLGVSDVARVDRAPDGTSARFACARTTDGRVRCWGSGRFLGYGGALERNYPVEPLGLPRPASRLAVGARVSCAVVFGDLWCWGDTFSSDAFPPTFSGRTGVRLVAVSNAEVCTVEADERIRCFGWGSPTATVLPGF
ncbi:MAG TPA: hypothetical protein RMH99_01585 [Sandaracinaceae bacterium LLY-WYZ-13_1]|nr:hypothetical protein [Sandaracinaceae bacterium LLY-WYZ-13_1]